MGSGSLRRRFCLVVVIAISLTLAASRSAAAAVPWGGLTQLASPQNCFSAQPVWGCGEHLRGVGTGVGSLAMSSDGHNLYVTTGGPGSVMEFKRLRSGRLRQLSTPNDCVGGADSGTLCPHQAAGLQDPGGIVISPDGKNVYVASTGGDAVVEFSRGRRGALRQLGGSNACIGLAAPPDAGGLPCPRHADGLDEPTGIAMSRSGRYVYVLGQYSSTLVVFRRLTTGALRFAECVQQKGLAGRYAGTSQCHTTANGLTNPSQVVVSAKGNYLYVSSAPSRSVAAFAGGSGGRLREFECLGQDGYGCAGTPMDLAEAEGLTITPDARSVYLGAQHLVLPLRRSPDGRLHLLGERSRCVGAPGSGCPERGTGINWVDGLAVTLDGRSVYATGFASDALLGFSRAPSGALHQIGRSFSCLSPYPYSGCHRKATALWSPVMPVVSPGGGNVYVTAQESDALALFRRHRA